MALALAACAWLAAGGGLAERAAAASGATIVMYHRFGEPDYPSTSVTMKQFEAHLALLQSGLYNVLPVPEIVAAMRAGRPLPDRTIGITVDDAYRSVYDKAWPRLKAAGLPFTVFVATAAVDRGAKSYMSWDQIREMQAAGVTIGNHTDTHLHMVTASVQANRDAVRRAARRFTAELGAAPRLFAYPYGEASRAARAVVVDAGFDAAFGQHSGVVAGIADRFYLPRFTFNKHYGDLARFRRAVDALPLPVRDITPVDPLLVVNPPAFGFTIDESLGKAGLAGLGRLACYHSQFGRVDLERLGPRRIEIRFAAPFKPGRTRLNCTLPGPQGRWRWFGWQFFTKKGG